MRLNPQKVLTQPLQALLQLEDESDDVEISLLICDDPTIRRLNKEHRFKDKATDVLSFPQEDLDFPQFPGAEHTRALGDIVISLDTAQRQADAAGWSLESEVTLLGVHGLLHLLGYDDETREGALIMQQKTIAVFRTVGLDLPADLEIHPFFKEIEEDEL